LIRRKVQLLPEDDSTAGVALVMIAPPGVVISKNSEESVRSHPATAVIVSSPQTWNGIALPGWFARKVGFWVEEDARLEDVAECTRKEFLQSEPASGPHIQASVGSGEVV
jgi:hypothetical protein